MRIVIIGLGGIGSILSDKICRYLNYSLQETETNVVLVDGDAYERKNYERQEFTNLGNKATEKGGELQSKFKNLNIQPLPIYIDTENILDVISDGDTIFVCVDNHKTRSIVNDYCKALRNVTLISGGNELTDGNVQIFIRKRGKSLTPDLAMYHPEISKAKDKLPTEISCGELVQSEPQLFFTNLTVATIMCWVFYNILNSNMQVSEIYFDIQQMKVLPKVRQVKEEENV